MHLTHIQWDVIYLLLAVTVPFALPPAWSWFRRRQQSEQKSDVVTLRREDGSRYWD
jgi:hypothetical protein